MLITRNSPNSGRRIKEIKGRADSEIIQFTMLMREVMKALRTRKKLDTEKISITE